MQADLVAPREDLDFYDARGIDLTKPITALEAWNLAMRHQLPGVSLAFRIRDAISAHFGVRRIGGFSGRLDQEPRQGDRLDFFLVERVEPEILTLSERDRHLDVVTCITTHGQRLTITSSVKVHNVFGRLYMIPVAPAHRLIVSAMMRRIQRDIHGG
ncbi:MULTISPECIES: DUF2867 domain-containing protein [unclassified Yoonia]|uniref:DUF2867 domain-containing protein n=1 Tax=unclassified Yoonia TaxID=2629118 RepID=UPI002AFE730A|nr:MULTISPECIES: DUF2867 domain-containing protein [unclassified Yoonia]